MFEIMKYFKYINTFEKGISKKIHNNINKRKFY